MSTSIPGLNETLELPSSELRPSLEDSLLKILNPYGGEIYEAGSAVAIYWTGGPDVVREVGIYLVDNTAWAVAMGIGVAAYSNTSPYGFYQWVIPAEFHPDHAHKFQIYIEDSPRTSWIYGPLFKIT